jgi:hypothetical protein
MLAGGMVIAAPSMVPTAAAAGALYVSAENAQFDNLFGGPMVVEVIVKDPNRSLTNENQGEPTVMVDNQQLRMAQGLDGNWYGYFADNTDVATVFALKTATNTYPLNFGTTADLDVVVTYSADQYNNGTLADSSNFSGVIDNPPLLSNWSNGAVDAGSGQIVITDGEWPILQTFDFTQEDFDVIYEQAGNDEVVTLEHNNNDLDDYASLTLDRNSATQGAEVMLFIVDQALNIDPTDEDVVIFKVADSGSATGSGVAFTNGTINWQYLATATNNYTAASSGFAFDDNGKLLIDMDAAGTGNALIEKDATADDTVVSVTSTFTYLVFFEDADNTGTFSNVDDLDDANLDVVSTAPRGATVTFDYNDSAQSFTVANDFGTLDMDESSVGDEWNSGENLVVTLADQDLNKNTLNDEDMTLRTHNTTIPAMIIGSPITLDESSLIGAAQMNVSSFNKIGTIQTASDTGSGASYNVTVTFPGTTVADFRTAHTAADFIFVNYNVTQVVNTVSGIGLGFNNGTALITTEGTTATAGLLQLDNALVAETQVAADELKAILLNFTGASDGLDAAVGETLYVDIFTFGDKSGYDRQNNAIYRLLLEETGNDTGLFIGDVEFIMLNQINYNVATTYSTLDTLSDEISISHTLIDK